MQKVLNIVARLKKEVPHLPLFSVRIYTDTDQNVCGHAIHKSKIIYINKDFLESQFLDQIVLHEILHAILGIKHNKKCRLMQETIDETLTAIQAYSIAIDYFYKG